MRGCARGRRRVIYGCNVAENIEVRDILSRCIAALVLLENQNTLLQFIILIGDKSRIMLALWSTVDANYRACRVG